jgi:hypothetical protein
LDILINHFSQENSIASNLVHSLVLSRGDLRQRLERCDMSARVNSPGGKQLQGVEKLRAELVELHDVSFVDELSQVDVFLGKDNLLAFRKVSD